MSIEDLQAGWERLGARDPLWAVLTDPNKRDGRWTKAEFLAAGEDEVSRVFQRMRHVGAVPGGGRALDFGCGAGRLTQALAKRFDRVDGVDIAGAMLVAARRLGPPDTVSFHHNPSADLGLFPDSAFDFVYSSIVLQHMGNDLVTGYISEFVRVTKTGGVIVFQAPDAYVRPRPTLRQHLRIFRARIALRTRLRGCRRASDTERASDATTLQSHPTPETLVTTTLSIAGAVLLDVAVTNSLDEDFNGKLRYAAGPPLDGWLSKQYIALVR